MMEGFEEGSIESSQKAEAFVKTPKIQTLISQIIALKS